ncbi:NAD-dependent epimerase/dehydratase family protein [bacterium]|nr:NAD-dependent epimerase/dehydratase family protein [bacterium]
MKSVLVTGAGGFIGLNIVKTFASNGWQVYALVHRNIPEELSSFKNVSIVKGDVTNEESIIELNLDVDVCVHVAGLARDVGKDEDFRKVNFEPIKYLSRIPREKIVYISSSDVYGIKDFINADENTPLAEFPKNPYPRYKIMSENWLRENCSRYVIIRPAAVWGEGDKTLENRFREFLEVSPFIIHFGKWKGQNRWPLANVKNVAKTVLSVSTFNDFDNQSITVIDPEKTTIDDYYRQIGKKYFPDKKFKTITLPFWIGKVLGFISTAISNILGLTHPIFDPTFYAVHHVSSNLDFSSKKMEKAIELLETQTTKY